MLVWTDLSALKLSIRAEAETEIVFLSLSIFNVDNVYIKIFYIFWYLEVSFSHGNSELKRRKNETFGMTEFFSVSSCSL